MFGNGNINPFAVLTNIDEFQSLQAARILSFRHKIPVIAIVDRPNHPFCRTNSCKKVNLKNDNYLETLISIGKKIQKKSVLYTCREEDVLLVSKNREILKEFFHFQLPHPDVVEMMIDKLTFYKYAQKYGFKIPNTFFIYSQSDLDEAIKELRFPCVFKPHFITPLWYSLSNVKAFKVSSPKDLQLLYEKLKEATECFILQDWIEGPDSNLYSCNVYFDAESKPLATFVAKKLRQWPPEMGRSSLGVECENDLVLNETLRLYRAVNFRGLGYLEMKLDEKSGEYFIIEPNICRPTGRSAIAEAGGVDLLFTMYCDLLGRPLPETRVQNYTGVKWIYLRQDLQAAYQYRRCGQLSLKQWLSSVRGRKAYAIFSWRDPLPFWADLLPPIYRTLKKKLFELKDLSCTLLPHLKGKT